MKNALIVVYLKKIRWGYFWKKIQIYVKKIITCAKIYNLVLSKLILQREHVNSKGNLYIMTNDNQLSYKTYEDLPKSIKYKRKYWVEHNKV